MSAPGMKSTVALNVPVPTVVKVKKKTWMLDVLSMRVSAS
jgi:hypothetical protein